MLDHELFSCQCVKQNVNKRFKSKTVRCQVISHLKVTGELRHKSHAVAVKCWIAVTVTLAVEAGSVSVTLLSVIISVISAECDC